MHGKDEREQPHAALLHAQVCADDEAVHQHTRLQQLRRERPLGEWLCGGQEGCVRVAASAVVALLVKLYVIVRAGFRASCRPL